VSTGRGCSECCVRAPCGTVESDGVRALGGMASSDSVRALDRAAASEDVRAPGEGR
jgi:hypothetical protein